MNFAYNIDLKTDTPGDISRSLGSFFNEGMGIGRNNGDGLGEGVGEGVCNRVLPRGGGGGGARLTKTFRSDDDDDVLKCPMLVVGSFKCEFDALRTGLGLVGE